MSLDERYGAIQQKMRADYSAHRSEWMNLWNAQSIDTRLEAGDSALTSELNAGLPNNFTAQWYINMVRPRLNMVGGHQRNTRKASIIVPTSNGDQETADQWTKIIMQIYKKESVYSTISEAFHQGALVSGLNLMQIYMDFTLDPLNGDIKIDRVPYPAVIMDPYWKKLDLSDCSFVERRHYVRYEEACALIPDQTDFIMGLPAGSAGTRKNDKFTYMPQNFGLSTQRLLSYDEYYYRTYRDQTVAFDKETGDSFEIKINDPERIRTLLQRFPQVTINELRIPTVRMAIAVQDKVLFEGPLSTGDHFPFVPVVGFFSPELTSCASRFQGMARSLRDVQMLFNRRLILNSDLAESLVTSGVFYKEGSVLDETHLYQTGAGRNVPVDRNCNIAADIVPRQAAVVPPEFFKIQEDYQNLFGPVSGINDANMGTASDDIPGITTRLKMGSGLTTLEPLFDSLDRSQVILTERIMEAITRNFTPGKIKSMLGGQEEPAPLFYNEAFGKYHCMVESGYDTESQKQLQFAQMYQLMQVNPDIFDSEDILEAATIQNKTKMIEKSKQRQQAAQQAQQQQAQAQQELQQAQIEGIHAQAQASYATGRERDSRVPENLSFSVQRLSEAEEQRELAVLNKVKALKELEEIDITHLEKLLAMAAMLKDMNKVDEQNLKQETVMGTQPLAQQPQQPI